MRNQLKQAIERFGSDNSSIESLAESINQLASQHITDLLTQEEAKLFSDLDFLVGLYDPKLPPRKGMLGRCLDFLESIGGRDRVSFQQIKNKAVQLLILMQRSA